MSASYAGVVLAAPVSLGYTRISTHAAPWFVGAALEAMLKASGLPKSAIDGLAVGSFTLAPDSVVTLTQYYDMEARFLESLPFGGASGIVALRRAARAVQCGDAEVIACIGADTNRSEGFRDLALSHCPQGHTPAGRRPDISARSFFRRGSKVVPPPPACP